MRMHGKGDLERTLALWRVCSKTQDGETFRRSASSAGEDFHAAVGGQEKIRRLQIAVDDSFFMCGTDPTCHLYAYDRLRRFEQEAHAAGALNHANILAIYDIGTHEGSPFLVIELLGETLRDRLQSGPLPLRKALDTGSEEKEAGRTFIATSRLRRASRARKTSPIPPAPSGAKIS